jgi:2'-5' RNA ligase
LGNISVNDLPIFIQSLKKELTQNSFAMVIEFTRVFPFSHSPRVLWLGIKRGGAEELI